MITHFAFETNQHLQIPRAKDRCPHVKHTSDVHRLEFAHTYPSAMLKALIPTTFLTLWILPHAQTSPSSVRTSAGSWERSSSICQVGAWVQNKALSAAAVSDFSALQYLTRTAETRSHSHLEPLIMFCCHRCSVVIDAALLTSRGGGDVKDWSVRHWIANLTSSASTLDFFAWLE